MRKARIAGKHIGPPGPVYFIAELGICHEGSLDIALELVDAAAKAKADCVKTEAFQRKTLVADAKTLVDLEIDGKKVTMPLKEHMAEFELGLEDQLQIKTRCDELGLPFMATVHDTETVDFLADIKAAAAKIASPDIVHYPLLRSVARSGLAVVMDTGSALLHEVVRGVEELRRAGARNIVVNYNPRGHPAPISGHNLGALRQMQTALGVPVGISDHYQGYEMAYAAVAAGADLIEKPISLDRHVPGPEKAWSVSAKDLAGLVDDLKELGRGLTGMPHKMTREQQLYRRRNRVSCVAGRDIARGETLDEDCVVFARPHKGIGVEHWDMVRGRRIARTKKAGQFINWKDLA